MRRRRQGLQVSTFPFMAVLLCAMGSLILLLFIIDRRAKIVARQKALGVVAAAAEDRDRKMADRRAEWERRCRELHALLESQGKDLRGQLATLTGKAQAAAAQTREEEAIFQSLQARYLGEKAALEQTRQLVAQKRAELGRSAEQAGSSRDEVDRLARELGQMEQTLQALLALRRQKQESYSLVPYRGRRGDERRPIYVECTGAGVTFHPGPKHLPGSALNALEIRAEVERRLALPAGETAAPAAKPGVKNAYLLLLIRPDGVETYYQVLGAVEGLKIDYGYEMIDAHWALNFSEGNALPAESLPAVAQGAGAGTPGKGRVVGVVSSPPPVPAKAGAGTMAEGTGPGFSQALKPGSPDHAPGTGLSGKGGGPGFPPGAGPVLAKPAAPGNPGFGIGLGVPTWRPAEGQGPGGLPAGSPFRPGMGGQGDQASPSSPPGDPASAGGPSPGGKTGPALPPQVASGAGEPPGLASRTGTPGEPSAAGNGEGGEYGPPGAGSAGGGEEGDPALPPEKPPPLAVAVPRGGDRPRPAPSPLSRILGNRDLIILLDCTGEGLVVLPGGDEFPAPSLRAGGAGESPLTRAVRGLIDRRQATVRPGEPPYRPVLRFQVRPDGLRTYYLAYPLLETLGVPMVRENLDE